MVFWNAVGTLTIVRRTQSATPVRRGKLCHPSGRGRGGNGDAESEDEAATEEHAPILRRGNNRRADEDDQAADDHTSTATKPLASGAREECTGTLTDCVNQEH